MSRAHVRAVFALPLFLATVACGSEKITPTTPTTPAPAPVVTISAPTLVGPSASSTAFGWPTFVWNNATKTNTTNALMYRLDVSLRDDFTSVSHTMMVPEGSGQTSYAPASTVPLPPEGNLYWRVVAMDQANSIQSQPSETRVFAYYENTQQNRVAVQLYGSLWPSARPTGTRGRARLGPGWDATVRRSFDGVTFQSPPLEVLRIYDLLDLGMSPDAAIAWMRANGYPTVAVWYPSVSSIGFPFQYMALIPPNFSTGSWELVHRVGA